jgi:hypothetical protein
MPSNHILYQCIVGIWLEATGPAVHTVSHGQSWVIEKTFAKFSLTLFFVPTAKVTFVVIQAAWPFRLASKSV